jgi:hypothetical protein
MSGRYWLWRMFQSEAGFYAIGGRHYRCGTVPYTAKGKASHHYFRYPRTTQELRWNDATARDGDLRHHKVRLTRRGSLPTAYDDFCIGAREIRNWKQFRRAQWKDQGGPRS